MVRFKTEDHLRKENAEKRGGGYQRGESVFQKADEGATPGIANFSDGELTADELTSFQEEHLQLMNLLGEETLQEVVTLRMEEYKVSEIAKHFDKSERWVKRKLALIRDIWSGEIDPASS